ncbi:MAG: hypothetical protein CVV51_00795 [Spirochaetae bacterium HGW-Spirochaetae-7]|nr:MAG: hypothetical protein CVV51_00795 [Spirochaetae bacterium HGW-Spirochaetae-7]
MKVEGRRTILLVEDEAIIAMQEKKALEKHGYAVILAYSGAQAVEVFKENGSIDLVLMDIDLGAGIDGTEAARIMLGSRDLPVVFLSSHTEPEVVEKTEGITSYGYIVKSSSATVLDASIKMAFKLFEANDRLMRTNVKLEATLDALPDMLFELGLDGCYHDVHCKDDALLFLPVAELIGRTASEVLPPEISGVIMAAIDEASRMGSSMGKQYRLDVPAGSRWFEVSVSMMASSGNEKRFILICRDFTARKQAADDLEESKRYAERLLNVSAEIILATDPSGNITLLNENGHRLLGYRSPELIGKNWARTCLPENARDEVGSLLSGLEEADSGTLVSHENNVLCRNGEERLILWHNTVLHDKNGAFSGILSSGEDVTAYRDLEDRIRQSEARYRTIIEASPDSITVTDMQGRIVLFSHKALPMFGYDEEEDPFGRPVTDFMVPDDRERAVANIMLLVQGSALGAEEYRGLRKDGSTFDMEINGELIRDQAGQPTQALFIVRDITARKRLLGKYKLLFDLSPVGIALVDHETGRFLDANASMLRSAGYSRDELLSMTYWDITPPEYNDQEDEQVRMLDEIGFFGPNKKEYVRKDGSRYPISISGAIFTDDSRRKVVWGLIEDITEREAAENRVKALLGEKELILKEVHHRIKNNFSTLRSLLNLQSDSIRDPGAIAAFRATEGRIQSMALLYEKLYESSDFITVSLADYLPPLVAEIISNFPNAGMVTMEVKAEDLQLNARLAQPLGIIVNELVTNAMKYAFVGRDRGRIGVSATLAEGNVLLAVEDDGVGDAGQAEDGMPSGFGLTLVTLLASQLRGSIAFERVGGTRAVLAFPA